MSRYPSITPVDGRPITGLTPRMVQTLLRAAKEIRRRTGYSMWYNRNLRTAVYCMGIDPARGCAQMEPVFNRNTFSPPDVRRMCRILHKTARQSASDHDRVLARIEERKRDAIENEYRKRAEDIGDEFRSRARFVVGRFEAGHKVKPTVLVP